MDKNKPRVWWRLLVLVLGVQLLTACDSMGVDDQQLVTRAREYLADNNIGAAAIELRNALQENPDNAEARYLLGSISLDVGDYPAAEKEFRRAGKAGWAEPDVMLGLARAYMGLQDYRKLLEDTGLQDAWPATVRANLLGLRAVAEAGLGDMDKARLVAAQGASLDAGALQVVKASIQLQLIAGDLPAAKELLEAALERYSNDPELLLLSANLHLQGGDRDVAEKIYRRLIAADPAGVMTIHGRSARLRLVQMQILAQQLQEAADNLKPLYRRSPNDPYTNYLGGALAFAEGDYDRAEERLLKVLKLAPEHNPTRLLFGTVNYAQQDYEQAAYFLSKYLLAVPENMFARKLLGRSYMLLGENQAARGVLQSAPDQENKDAELLALAGLSELQRGETAAGIAGLERAVAADPGQIAYREELARAYITVGETGLAIRELKQVLADGGQQTEVETLIVLAHLRAGEFEQAINQVLDLLAVRPDDPAVMALAGNVFATSGDRNEARKYFNRALAVRPDFPPAILALARLEELDGNMAEARKQYEKLIAGKDAILPLLALARMAEQADDRQQMVAWLQQARETAPGEINPRIFLAEYYLREQQLDMAQTLVTEAAGISPQSPVVLAMQGRILMAQNNHQAALTPLMKLVELQPNAVTALLLRGECLLQLGRLGDARRDLEQALAQQASDITALALMVQLEIKLGNFGRALEFGRRMQQEYPELYLGYELAGDVWMAQQKYSKAAGEYTQAWARMQNSALAIKLSETSARTGDAAGAARYLQTWLSGHENDARARQFLGIARQNLGQNEEAVQEYERVLSMDPDNPVVLNNLAWLYMQAGNPQALALAERAYRANPDNPGVMDTYGWIQVQQGEVDSGLRLLKQAVEQLSGVAEVRYHYAVALYKSGDRKTAVQLLEALLGEDTPFEGREEARRMLDSAG